MSLDEIIQWMALNKEYKIENKIIKKKDKISTNYMHIFVCTIVFESKQYFQPEIVPNENPY